MTELSNDRYERIRQALAMGPTPGPRRVIDGNSYPYVTVAMPENEGHRWDDPIVCALYEDVTPDDYVGFGARLQAFPNARANAHLIAACDPDTIRELLEERDALAAEVERLHEALRELEDELRREVERRWEGNRRALQEYLEDMSNVLKEAAQACRELDEEALAKEGRLACGAECAAAIADVAVRWNVPFERGSGKTAMAKENKA